MVLGHGHRGSLRICSDVFTHPILYSAQARPCDTQSVSQSCRDQARYLPFFLANRKLT